MQGDFLGGQNRRKSHLYSPGRKKKEESGKVVNPYVGKEKRRAHQDAFWEEG